MQQVTRMAVATGDLLLAHNGFFSRASFEADDCFLRDMTANECYSVQE
jgi:hypothetical protein